MPLAGIHAGRDAIAARTGADADTDVAAFAAVLADGAFAVLRRLQGNVPRRIERQVFARFQLAAGDGDIATLCIVVLAVRRYRQVLPGGERAALRLAAVGAGFALRRLAAVGSTDADGVGGAFPRICVESSSAACAACTPDSAALVFCSAFRRTSPSFRACCAELTAVLSAPPTVPDSATLRPLCFCS